MAFERQLTRPEPLRNEADKHGAPGATARMNDPYGRFDDPFSGVEADQEHAEKKQQRGDHEQTGGSVHGTDSDRQRQQEKRSLQGSRSGHRVDGTTARVS